MAHHRSSENLAFASGGLRTNGTDFSLIYPLNAFWDSPFVVLRVVAFSISLAFIMPPRSIG